MLLLRNTTNKVCFLTHLAVFLKLEHGVFQNTPWCVFIEKVCFHRKGVFSNTPFIFQGCVTKGV